MSRTTSFDVDGREIAGRTALVRPVVVRPEDELELKGALDDYKRRSGRLFPTWSEVLEVLGELGYAKRVWRPVEPASASRPESSGPPADREGFGEDPAAGVLCWYARVETHAAS